MKSIRIGFMKFPPLDFKRSLGAIQVYIAGKTFDQGEERLASVVACNSDSSKNIP